MTKDKPTQKELKKFWEWVLDRRIEVRTGFIEFDCGDFRETQSIKDWIGERPTEKRLCVLWETKTFKDDAGKTQVLERWEQIPELDLNNLFKYAVPKLGEKKYYAELYYDIPIYVATIWRHEGGKATVERSKDPVLALFWAIWQVMEALND